MTIPSWARVGVRVKCINPYWWQASYASPDVVHGPSFAEVCVIARVGFDGIEAVVWLEGYGDEDYDLASFRPLTTTKTQSEDVAMIRSLIKDEVNA